MEGVYYQEKGSYQLSQLLGVKLPPHFQHDKTEKVYTYNIPFSSTALSTRDGKNPIPIKNDLMLVPDELATLSCNYKGRTKQDKELKRSKITH